MEQKLIKGGIYSVKGLYDIYCIYLGTYLSKLLFFEVKTEYNNAAQINDDIQMITSIYTEDEIRKYINAVDENQFIQNNDGFIGTVKPWVLNDIQATLIDE